MTAVNIPLLRKAVEWVEEQDALDAVREQVPEPEPPKRWTAQACGHTDATACLVDTQAPQRHEAHHWLVTLDEARRLADLLNEEASR